MYKCNNKIKSIKKYLILSVAASISITSCVGLPDIDFSNVDSVCSQNCTINHSECMRGFTFFPLYKENACNNSLVLCVKACPSKAVETSTEKHNKVPTLSTTAEKLKELKSLYESGLISKEEYRNKKKKILNEM